MKRDGYIAVLGAVCALATMATSPASSLWLDEPPANGAVTPSALAAARSKKSLSREFHADRLESVFSYLRRLSGVEFDPMWMDETHADGFDLEGTISLKFNAETVLAVAERVLAAIGGQPGTCAWQITDRGAVQVGPKSRLNEFRRIEVYPVADLLLATPDFTNVPTLDLQSALHNSGSGTAAVFRETAQ